MSKSKIDPVLAHIDANIESTTAHLFDLLRIPSVSTDPSFKSECDRAANWLVQDLNSIGFTASKRATTGNPMVVAHGRGTGTHVLFYGHYDVQPVDPLDLWDSPPFEPVLEHGDLGQ